MIGAPPGYVGYEEGGQLTEAVRRKPYSVVLLDEVEKAHHDVFNVLLQVLDDGRITDSKGRTVDFKNTIIIMTSNIGANILLEGINSKGDIDDVTRDEVLKSLRNYFRPEFLNRVDETVLFKPLTLQDINLIIDLLIKDIEKRLSEKRIIVKLSNEAKEFISKEAYDPIYGARPIRRYIQRNIETIIGRAIIKGKVVEDCEIEIKYNNGFIID